MFSEFWENQCLVKSIYSKFVEPVCRKYGLSRIELDIILFLANNPQYDTASSIVENKGLAKSHVSMALKSLELHGFLSRQHRGSNRKTVHLTLCESAQPIIHDGVRAQEEMIDVIFHGISKNELKQMHNIFNSLMDNIRKALREDSK